MIKYFFACLEMCLFLNEASGTPTFITTETIGLLSYIRYYLAWKTANTEGYQPFRLIAIVTSVYLIEHFSFNFLNYIVAMYFNLPTAGIGACAGESLIAGPPIMPIFHSIRGVISLSFGIR